MLSSSNSDQFEIIHQPYGEQRPYHRLPWERLPRDPAAGEKVTLSVEIRGGTPADQVWVIWQVVDCPPNRAMGVKCTGEKSEIWQVQLPAFSGGDVVNYRLFAAAGEQQVESEDFTFSVATWVDATAVYSIEQVDGGFEAILATQLPELMLHLQMQPDDTGTITMRLSALQQSQPSKEMLEEPWMLNRGDIRVTLSGSPVRLEVLRISDGLALQSDRSIQMLVTSENRVLQYRLGFESPQDEAFYGFGERFNALNQRGNRLDNYVYAQHSSQEKCSYIPIPFFVSSRRYGLWLKTNYQAEFDLAATRSSQWFLIGTADEVHTGLEMKLFFQPHLYDVIKAFTNLSGKPKLPPSWVFGLWMSSNDWNSQAEIERQVQLAEQYQIPATVMVIEAWSDEINFYIWNDAQYEKKHPSQAYRLSDFTFPEHGRWPDPKTMIDALHQDGIRLVLWQIPVMKKANPEEGFDETQKAADQEFAVQNGYVVQKADGSPHRIEPHSPWFTGSMVFDFTNPEAAEWWSKKRAYLLTEMGVDGFKTDGGEHIWDTETRFHNGMRGSSGINHYPLAYESAYHQLLQAQRGTDHVLFSRSGYTGIQQYSSHWAGDEKSTWEAYRASVRAMLNAGMSGVPFFGWDIAGFSGDLPSSDLYLRAAAFSALCPIMQYHSEYNARLTPSRDRTPWNIQECTGDLDVIRIFRQFTNLRMNLIPYILGQAAESSHSGLPLMRALPLAYPEDAACREFPYEYLFGDALLVAPVVEEGQSSWRVYLPQGEWCDFWSGEVYDGQQIIDYAVPKDRIPLFQRSGSIIPLNLDDSLDLCSTVGGSTETIKNLAALIFPGEINRVEVFQGQHHPNAAITAQRDARNKTVLINPTGFKLALDLFVIGDRPEEVRLDGTVLPYLAESSRSEFCWTWMEDRHAARLHLADPQGAARIEFVF